MKFWAFVVLVGLLWLALNLLARRDVHQCQYAPGRTGKSNRCLSVEVPQ